MMPPGIRSAARPPDEDRARDRRDRPDEDPCAVCRHEALWRERQIEPLRDPHQATEDEKGTEHEPKGAHASMVLAKK